MFGILNKKRWKNSARIINSYHEFDTVDYGIAWVDPRDIIGLSLNPNKIKNDEKMKKLKSSVYANGWTNESPFTLHLCKLPNGKYTVSNGGNHRAYLSNKLKTPHIQALVTIIIPKNLIPEEIKAQIEYFILKENDFELKAKETNEFLSFLAI
ncbi:hypothetical protein JNUCC1_02638 [Lentibacillus sp. JNUCC-1]|uniref:hypothetical protein n=1 Tax=Lentibacillus sp. JNUCC-1 TaxID=2654513 RepID=UPI0012E901E4|nr:hypothetical protein [Lentibacillus sp. JNUCC-1]MUV38767.1 hypothetical protein [Lentibacillus sp. JNUCC-1]